MSVESSTVVCVVGFGPDRSWGARPLQQEEALVSRQCVGVDAALTSSGLVTFFGDAPYWSDEASMSGISFMIAIWASTSRRFSSW